MRRHQREYCGFCTCHLVAGRYFIEPVIAGLEDGKVYLCATDLIGAKDEPADFIVTGTCYESLLGMAESLWRPGMEPDELFEVISQALLSAGAKAR